MQLYVFLLFFHDYFPPGSFPIFVFFCIFTPPFSNLEEQPQFVYDENGQITGYTTKIGGADTVFPFSSRTSFARFLATDGYLFNSGEQSGAIAFNSNVLDSSNFGISSDLTVIEVKQDGNYFIDVHITAGSYTTFYTTVNEELKLGDNSYTSGNMVFTTSHHGELTLNKGDKLSVKFRGTAWSGVTSGYHSDSWFSIGKLTN